jgi:hypothetical protein
MLIYILHQLTRSVCKARSASSKAHRAKCIVNFSLIKVNKLAMHYVPCSLRVDERIIRVCSSKNIGRCLLNFKVKFIINTLSGYQLF